MKRHVFLSFILLSAILGVMPAVGRCADDPSQHFTEKLARTRALLEARSLQATEPSTIASLPVHESQGIGWGRMLEGLALCVGVFLIGIGVVRRRRKQQGLPIGRRMRILERLPVSTRGAVVLMKLDGREYLLGVGGEQVSVTPLPTAVVNSFQLVENERSGSETHSVIALNRAVGTEYAEVREA